MLKILHHHIYAGKLQRIFDDSCMVLVYQSLGSISADDIKGHLEKSIKSKHPKSGISASAFRIRNAVASGTKNEDFAKYFQASNLIVGWKVPQSGDSSPITSAAPAAAATSFVSSRSKTIFDLCGDFRDRQAQHRVPQRVIGDLIDASMKLSATQPLALLACFHKSQRFTVGELKEWSKLDEGMVLGELLGTLEGVPGPLLHLEDAAAEVSEALSEAGGVDLTATLDLAAARQ